MKKIISAIAATAIAASLALSTTVASAETYYTIPMDPAEWSTWLVNNPKLDETADLSAEELPGGEGMKVWFPDTATTVQIPNFLLNVGSGITQVSNGDDLHIDVTLDGPDGAWDARWNVEIAFNGAGTNRMQIAKYIAAATGNEKLKENTSSQLPSGTYNVVLDLEDLIKAYDADNDTNNYDKVFGDGGNRWLTTINFQMATNKPGENSDKDYALTIRDFSLGTDGSFDDINTGSSTTSTASTGGSTTSTASTGGSTTSTGSKASSTGGNKTSSSQVGTGENMLPVIGVAALAVVATSAVVVSKKRSK